MTAILSTGPYNLVFKIKYHLSGSHQVLLVAENYRRRQPYHVTGRSDRGSVRVSCLCMISNGHLPCLQSVQ